MVKSTVHITRHSVHGVPRVWLAVGKIVVMANKLVMTGTFAAHTPLSSLVSCLSLHCQLL